jgi:hypothetical protein
VDWCNVEYLDRWHVETVGARQDVLGMMISVEVIGVIEYKFDHSLSLICSILCSAVFNQSPYPFLQGVPFAAVRLWLPSLFRGELARAKTCLMQI